MKPVKQKTIDYFKEMCLSMKVNLISTVWMGKCQCGGNQKENFGNNTYYEQLTL